VPFAAEGGKALGLLKFARSRGQSSALAPQFAEHGSLKVRIGKLHNFSLTRFPMHGNDSDAFMGKKSCGYSSYVLQW